MSNFIKYKKPILISTLILTITLIGSGIFYYLHKPKLTELEKQGEIGTYILNNDFKKTPLIPIKQNESNYQLTDSLINGPTIEYANPPEELKDQPKNELNIEFPKNYQEPINIKLDEQRFITIKNTQGDKYNSKLITEELPLLINQEPRINNELNPENIDQPLEIEQGNNKTIEQFNNESKQLTSYLKYQSKDKRVSTYYAYQKDNNQRTLKHWTIYDKQKKDQVEKEEYQFTNAKLKLNDKGEVEVYYFGDQDLKNEEVKAQVDSNLMARAQRTLQKELGEDILNTNNHTPDFTIPQPYYINKNQERKTLTWEIDQESNLIRLNFKPAKDEYPIGLDPTMYFSAPGQDLGADAVVLSTPNNGLAKKIVAGDLDNDGDDDLVLGIKDYSANTGRIFIFYNDGSISSTISGADHMITGEGTGNYFGTNFLIADMNNDGTKDLVVNSCEEYYSSADKIYIFYSDGSYPTEAYLADKIIIGKADGVFGFSMAVGDLDNDGDNDLVTSDKSYNNNTGQVYVFYNDGSIPTNSADADVVINGVSAFDSFGVCLEIEDFNNNGVKDLVVSAASEYSTNNGKIFIFYSDGSYPANYSGADLFIDSSVKHFGTRFLMGDFNNDGKRDIAAYHTDYSTPYLYIFYNDGSLPSVATSRDIGIAGDATCSITPYYMSLGDYDNSGTLDIASGCYSYTSNTGRVQIFYNDGSFPASTASADLNITGEATSSYFGDALASGDINNDGRTDLISGAYSYVGAGRVYVFNNDGSIPTAAASSDLKINGEAKVENFGKSFELLDLNSDNKNDLVVGSYSNVYIFYSDGGGLPESALGADFIITGDIYSSFGIAITKLDINNDGKKDLVVGADEYSSSAGRVYVFYNDGTLPSTSATADFYISGESSSRLGRKLGSLDLNSDGRDDLIMCGQGYSSFAGRCYISYNDGSIPNTAASADIKITGESGSYLATSIEFIDINNDGVNDLVLGANFYSSYQGRVYVFYNDGTISATAAAADLIITGEASTWFGWSMTKGDFNNDGRIDLAVGGPRYTTPTSIFRTGRVYIFYNDGSIPSGAGSADLIIESDWGGYSFFGNSMSSGDFNADGRVDLMVAAGGYNGVADNGNKVYVFYNDGSIPTNALLADIIINGESSSGGFASNVYFGDVNLDGKDDLVVSATAFYGSGGKFYVFYAGEGQVAIPESIGDDGLLNKNIGYSLTSGDFDNDGDDDLAAGSIAFNSSKGRIYIFYNDGNIPNYAVLADVIIDGGSTTECLGNSMISLDIDNDGDDDLVVGAKAYNSNTGRVYVFNNDGSFPANSNSADIVITGEATGNYFGSALGSGDLNYDSRIDLIVGAEVYNTGTGRAYIFYNDGSIPITAATADVKITGGATSNYFGCSFAEGDFNYDGRVDIAIGAEYYSSGTGRTYIFYNDGSIPTTAATADLIITGETTSNYFSSDLVAGDFNSDGRIDLAVGAYGYSSNMGRVYIFYNDGSIPTVAASADAIITRDGTGNNCFFGDKLLGGDFDADGDTDLAVGSFYYPNNSSQGQIFVFYNDGSYSTVASGADLIYTGNASNSYFGQSMGKGDFNNDSRVDLVVGSWGYPGGYTGTPGQVYIFYNDGSYPATAEDADIKIIGDLSGNYFGASLASGDLNTDGKIDLVVGAYNDYAGRGKIYLFYNDSELPNSSSEADASIVGENIEDNFASLISVGDLNYDNRDDLIVGAKNYSLSTGRVYVFNNDGNYPSSAGSADNIITGEGIDNYFGSAFSVGDFNDDSRVDLAVGATGCNNDTGRVYIFNNDGSIPNLASNADNIITGEGQDDFFGYSLGGGDLNYDNKIDLIAGAYGYNNSTGRVYIFNNDGSTPSLASNADNVITGEGENHLFGYSMTTGDLNADGRMDLAVGAVGYAANYMGRVYIFYNDGSISSLASGGDVLINGDAINNYFGNNLLVNDFNLDGKNDLAVGAYKYNYNCGRGYIFYNNNGIVSDVKDADVVVTGLGGSYLAQAMTSGDFDGNNRIDLGVGVTVNSYYGSFYIYTTDAPGTKFDYVENNGSVKYNGSVLVR